MDAEEQRFSAGRVRPSSILRCAASAWNPDHRPAVGLQPLLQMGPVLPQLLGLVLRELHSLVSNSTQDPLLLLGDAAPAASSITGGRVKRGLTFLASHT